MKDSLFKYSVAIRTVGKGGDKYIQELRSLHEQTVKPQHIYVFLAHGFTRPETQVGIEEYIDTPKGLVHQRAAANMVEDDYILIIDDDVYFPPTAVETMWRALEERHADGIAPDTFPSQNMSFVRKAVAYMSNNVSPRRNDGWAIRIKPSGAFSFNNIPPQGSMLPTMSAAGTAVFLKTEAWKAIHYEDEEWIDEFPAGTFGEDQLMYYKLYINGYKLLMWYDSGCLHLDANTNKASGKAYEKLYYRAMSLYLTWHRSLYSVDGHNKVRNIGKGRLRAAFEWRYLCGCFTRVVFSLMNGSFRFLKAYVRGYRDAKKYVETEKYKKLPDFITVSHS